VVEAVSPHDGLVELTGHLQVASHLIEVLALGQQAIRLTELADDLLRGVPSP
jgi:hypothetical protein